jgi:hypothetical protein
MQQAGFRTNYPACWLYSLRTRVSNPKMFPENSWLQKIPIENKTQTKMNTHEKEINIRRFITTKIVSFGFPEFLVS